MTGFANLAGIALRSRNRSTRDGRVQARMNARTILLCLALLSGALPIAAATAACVGPADEACVSTEPGLSAQAAGHSISVECPVGDGVCTVTVDGESMTGGVQARDEAWGDCAVVETIEVFAPTSAGRTYVSLAGCDGSACLSARILSSINTAWYMTCTPTQDAGLDGTMFCRRYHGYDEENGRWAESWDRDCDGLDATEPTRPCYVRGFINQDDDAFRTGWACAGVHAQDEDCSGTGGKGLYLTYDAYGFLSIPLSQRIGCVSS